MSLRGFPVPLEDPKARGSETRGVLEDLRYSPEEISTLFEEHIVESSEADVDCLKE